MVHLDTMGIGMGVLPSPCEQQSMDEIMLNIPPKFTIFMKNPSLENFSIIQEYHLLLDNLMY